jgi:hypothetical protein
MSDKNAMLAVGVEAYLRATDNSSHIGCRPSGCPVAFGAYARVTAVLEAVADHTPVEVRTRIAHEVMVMNDAECELATDVQKALDFRVQLGVIEDVLDEALPRVAVRVAGIEAWDGRRPR